MRGQCGQSMAGMTEAFLESGLKGTSSLGESRILNVDIHVKHVFLFVLFFF